MSIESSEVNPLSRTSEFPSLSLRTKFFENLMIIWSFYDWDDIETSSGLLNWIFMSTFVGSKLVNRIEPESNSTGSFLSGFWLKSLIPLTLCKLLLWDNGLLSTEVSRVSRSLWSFWVHSSGYTISLLKVNPKSPSLPIASFLMVGSALTNRSPGS